MNVESQTGGGGRLVVGWGPSHPMEVGAEMGDNADEITETMVWVH